jgi:hypothetical protein
MFIPDPDLDFLPIPDPGVKKAPDPGSGAAILQYLLLGCAEILWGVDPAIGIGGSGGGGGGDRYPAVANAATVLQDAVAAVAEKAAVSRAVVRAVQIFGLPAGEHIETRKYSTAGKKKKGKKIKRQWRTRRKDMKGNKRQGEK